MTEPTTVTTWAVTDGEGNPLRRLVYATLQTGDSGGLVDGNLITQSATAVTDPLTGIATFHLYGNTGTGAITPAPSYWSFTVDNVSPTVVRTYSIPVSGTTVNLPALDEVDPIVSGGIVPPVSDGDPLDVLRVDAAGTSAEWWDVQSVIDAKANTADLGPAFAGVYATIGQETTDRANADTALANADTALAARTTAIENAPQLPALLGPMIVVGNGAGVGLGCVFRTPNFGPFTGGVRPGIDVIADIAYLSGTGYLEWLTQMRDPGTGDDNLELAGLVEGDGTLHDFGENNETGATDEREPLFNAWQGSIIDPNYEVPVWNRAERRRITLEYENSDGVGEWLLWRPVQHPIDGDVQLSGTWWRKAARQLYDSPTNIGTDCVQDFVTGANGGRRAVGYMEIRNGIAGTLVKTFDPSLAVLNGDGIPISVPDPISGVPWTYDPDEFPTDPRAQLIGADPATLDRQAATPSAGGAVDSVNGETGTVVLTASDITGSLSAWSVGGWFTEGFHRSGGTTPTFNADSGSIGAGFVTIPNAVNNYIELDVELAAGTWDLELMRRQLTSSGVQKVYLSGVLLGTCTCYAGSTTRNARSTFTGITVAATGKHTLKIINDALGTGAGGYTGEYQSYQFRRTA